MKNLKQNLFDLTPEQEEKSRLFYGKIIKCIVAPYDTRNTLKESNTFLIDNIDVYVFPERNLSIKDRQEYLGKILSNDDENEILIITSDLFIITNIINDCIRILDINGNIVECEEKTFGANAHTILWEILANFEVETKEKWKCIVQDVINKIKSKKITEQEFKEFKIIIKSIGESMISNKLGEMLIDLKKL